MDFFSSLWIHQWKHRMKWKRLSGLLQSLCVDFIYRLAKGIRTRVSEREIHYILKYIGYCQFCFYVTYTDKQNCKTTREILMDGARLKLHYILVHFVIMTLCLPNTLILVIHVTKFPLMLQSNLTRSKGFRFVILIMLCAHICKIFVKYLCFVVNT